MKNVRGDKVKKSLKSSKEVWKAENLGSGNVSEHEKLQLSNIGIELTAEKGVKTAVKITEEGFKDSNVVVAPPETMKLFNETKKKLGADKAKQESIKVNLKSGSNKVKKIIPNYLFIRNTNEMKNNLQKCHYTVNS